MLNRLIRICSFFLLLFAAVAVIADETDKIIVMDDDEIIFEAEDIVIEDVLIVDDPVIKPGQVTVFDRESIETSGARNVADVIERAPGLVVSRQGGILDSQTVSIRGSQSDHVLILIDGKPAESLWSGSSDLSKISVQNVERIEVIRGAGTAIYGEGAFSGVINIITRKEADDFAAGLEYGYGAYNTHSADADLSGTISDEAGLSGRLSAGWLSTDGNYTYQAGDTEETRTNSDGWNADVSGGLAWETDDYELSASGGFRASEQGSPGLMEFLTPDARSKEYSSNAAVLFSSAFSESWGFSADADFNQSYSSYINSDDDVDEANSVFGFDGGADLSGSLEAGSLLIDLSVAAGGSWNILDSTALTDSTGAAVDGTADQATADLRLMAGAEWGSFDFTPAAAFDWFFSNYAGLEPIADCALTWSAAAGCSPYRSETDEGPLYFKVNIGTSYKYPSFQDLFWPSGAFASGNPDLEAEHGISGDLGVYLNFPEPDLKFEAAGYFGIAEDLIQWIPSAGGVWRPQNIGSVLNYGVELSAAYAVLIFDFLEMELSAAYSWTNAVDWDETSVNYLRQLAYRPAHSGSGGILLQLPKQFSLEFDAVYIGLRYTNNSNTKYLDPALVFSAALNFDVTDYLRLSASAENLTDEDYVDTLGYPVPGFEWALKGRLSLK